MISGYERTVKRVLDAVLSSIALVVLSPLIGLACLAIWLEDRGAPIFRQVRVGADGVLYELLKLRSMPVNTAQVPSVRAGSLRTTRVGKFIRRTNIDELPQLVNIVRGDMSVVGPRPALASQVALLELRRANGADRCKPGLTGMAQVHSYDGMPETEKAAWDGRYAACVSLAVDCTLILRTFGYLLRRPPVY